MVTPTKATKTTAAKRAKKAAPAAPPPADVDVVAEAEESADGTGQVTITWQDRTMVVRRPSAAMVAVWQLTAKEMQQSVRPGHTMSGEEAADAAGRAVRVTVSVLEDPADKSWVMGLLLDDHVTIEEAAQILALTNEAYQKLGPQGDNRQERRAVAKASKARLR